MECDQIGVKWFKTKFKPKKLMRVLTKWQEGLPWNSCYFENHDQPRSVTRFTKGGEYRAIGAKMLLGLLFSLRGTTYVYQGQEIGMTNGAFGSLDEIMDIESHNVDKMAKKLGIINPFRWKMIKATSRDNARTPMQWNGGKNAGFTDGKPWYQVANAVKVPVIGMGGVSSAEDVIEMMLAGATAVEVGAANLVDPFACRDIISDLPRVMDTYKINTLSEIIGGVK